MGPNEVTLKNLVYDLIQEKPNVEKSNHQAISRHTAVGDMMTVVCLDDYHTNDRAGRKVRLPTEHWAPFPAGNEHIPTACLKMMSLFQGRIC